jgi:hypothetical protein
MVYTLSNDRLLSDFITNNQIVETFPFLQQLKSAAPPEDCPPCQEKKKQVEFRKVAERTKAHLAALPPDSATTLKRLLNLPPGAVIRIYYLQNNKTQTVMI